MYSIMRPFFPGNTAYIKKLHTFSNFFEMYVKVSKDMSVWPDRADRHSPSGQHSANAQTTLRQIIIIDPPLPLFPHEIPSIGIGSFKSCEHLGRSHFKRHVVKGVILCSSVMSSAPSCSHVTGRPTSMQKLMTSSKSSIGTSSNTS